MRKMQLGRTGEEISVLTMGTLSMGGDQVWGPSDDEESIRSINAAKDLGITCFDTAAFYGFGRSETILGKALKEDRNHFIVSTKCGLDWDTGEGSYYFERNGHKVTRDLSAKAVRRSVENSLKRLQMDHVDICYTHRQAVPPNQAPIEETMGEMTKLQKEGKIRFIGVSNVTLEQLKEYMKYGRVESVQQRMSMLTLTDYHMVEDYCLENGIMFQAYSVLERGLLTGAYTMDSVIRPGDARNEWCTWYQPEKRRLVLEMMDGWKDLCEKYDCSQAALSVAWLTQQNPNVNADIGSRKVKNITDNARGGEILLEAEDLQRMNAAVAKLHEETAEYGDPDSEVFK